MKMNGNNKTAAIAAYITWIGFIIAICIGDRSDRYVAHHLNQALVINIASVLGGVLGVIPLVGNLAASIVSVVVLVFWIMGIYRAATGSTEPLPFIGDIHLIG
jgi:uncharacterized membrane protein